jgi:hypothetical protein
MRIWDQDPGWKNSDPGSGDGKVIRDPESWKTSRIRNTDSKDPEQWGEYITDSALEHRLEIQYVLYKIHVVET